MEHVELHDESNNITLLVTSNGDKLVGVIVEQSSESVVLNNPLRIIVQIDPISGDNGFCFVPYLPCQLVEETTIKLDINDIQFKLTPTKFLKACYIKILLRDENRPISATNEEIQDGDVSQEDENLYEDFVSQMNGKTERSVTSNSNLNSTLVDYILRNMTKPKYVN